MFLVCIKWYLCGIFISNALGLKKRNEENRILRRDNIYRKHSQPDINEMDFPSKSEK